MKNILFLVSFCGLMLLSGISLAQQSGQSSTVQTHAQANIVVPISIQNIQNLNFGNIAVSASTGGTVALNPVTNQLDVTGGVTLPATSGTVQLATFEVSGAANFTYSISLPSQLNVYSGSNFMLVNNFISNPPNTGALDGTGKQLLKVGATLNVDPNQPSGSYISQGGGFAVTVQYN